VSEVSTNQELLPEVGTAGPRWQWLVVALIFAVVAWSIYYLDFYRKNVRIESFAHCLTANGAKMYGAWWCPHCADEKHLFGRAFTSVNYVECSPPGQRTQNDVCKQANIKGYPTWEFKDGSRLPGTQPLDVLSQRTACPLP
jgi:hypothetical protein